MNSQHDPGSHLFLVRFWREEAQEVQDQREWRGRVQHVLSGEAHSFGNLSMLLDVLIAVLPAPSPDVEDLHGHDGVRAPPESEANIDLECSQ